MAYSSAELLRVLSDQEAERKETLARSDIIMREVDSEKLLGYLAHPNILALLGIRRCGKSVLSWMLLNGKKYGYINFDDEALYGISASDLNSVLKAFYELYGDLDFLIFDEIQNVPGWELFANRMRRTKKVLLTGSNSEMLSGELSTHLTGRHVDYVLYPFSFREYCAYKRIDLEKISGDIHSTKTSAVMEKALGEYTVKGGLPESYLYGPAILKSIFGDIVSKDIKGRHSIRTGVIEALAKYLVTNYSREMSYTKLKDAFRVKKIETMRNYVRYFQDAYLIFVLERFSYKLKEQAIAPKKVYCIDTGLINAMGCNFSENKGRLMENLVCTQLHRQSQVQNTEIYYWKNAKQQEVDYVVKSGTAVSELIQVCYDLGEAETKEREISALLTCGKELRCKNQTVITWDHEENAEGIKYVPLWKWLIQK